MRLDLTPAVTRALEAAQRYAHTRELQPAHPLQGLLEEEEGRAALLCGNAGLDVLRAQSALGAVRAGPVEPRPWAALTREALVLARELALALTGEPTVASEALLLALLRGDAGLRERLEG